jgi:hypothetical protein
VILEKNEKKKERKNRKPAQKPIILFALKRGGEKKARACSADGNNCALPVSAPQLCWCQKK